MLKSYELFLIQVLHLRAHSIRQINEGFGYARNTIRKALLSANPPKVPCLQRKRRTYGKYSWFTHDSCATPAVRWGRPSVLEPFGQFLQSEISSGPVHVGVLLAQLRQRGYTGSKRALQRFLHFQRAQLQTTGERDCDWMRHVLQGAIDREQAVQALEGKLSTGDVDLLLEHVRMKPLKLRNRALAILACGKGIAAGAIADFLCVCRGTIKRYIREFRRHGVASVLDLSRKDVKKADDPAYAGAVFRVLHSPPADFGFNRTSWRMDDLQDTLARQGIRIARINIRKIIRKAGYKFYKARKVLTSTDPDYRKKLEQITTILSNPQVDEKFFSIDEFGPFAMKTRGGGDSKAVCWEQTGS